MGVFIIVCDDRHPQGKPSHAQYHRELVTLRNRVARAMGQEEAISEHNRLSHEHVKFFQHKHRSGDPGHWAVDLSEIEPEGLEL